MFLSLEAAPQEDRRRWMAVLARASRTDLQARLADCPALPPHSRLRGPETGLMMLRGRAGGDGAPFNLSEITVTRCAVSLPDGQVGHAYVTGRDLAQAELAALVDAALQDPARRAALLDVVIEPLAAAQAEAAAAQSRKAAATRVQFFTMATMR
ncbi:phosphonate C-P lyase system protein PhnG [Teichococcus deserti]|nr:phosphonate C-P lyase system protein PhnG [Pseudoroseomonas deserti]